jgi:predicted DNA-binding protein
MEPKTLTIQLSPEEYSRLEAEAKRLNLSSETVAHHLLQQGLAQVKPAIDPREALQRLRKLTESCTPVDPVELVRLGREELERRGGF